MKDGFKMRYLVGVSGGVDSVVLLHQLVMAGEHELIVAHFDHGIRPDSAGDARFVAGLAAQYRLPFTTIREELGETASEDRARSRRYRFLRKAAEQYEATIVTAHHADDMIETIAINLHRGTGWRGAAVLDTPEIVRPLLETTKQQIRTYAFEKRLEWVEDSTNSSDQYLRNRVRRRVSGLNGEQKEALHAVRKRQIALKKSIDQEVAQYINQKEYSRYYLTQIDESTAVELLRAMVIAVTLQSPTRPQLTRGLLAIKTARPGASSEIGGGVTLRFTKRTFIVETP